jgi:hypothetical protein
MLNKGQLQLRKRLTRIVLWALSLCLSIGIFSVSWSMVVVNEIRSVPVVLRATTRLALPVWLFCLPFVIIPKGPSLRKYWTLLLLTGTLIGPVAMGVNAIVALNKGVDAHTVWYGDPLIGIGVAWAMIYATIVGFLTSMFYVIALKLFDSWVSQ